MDLIVFRELQAVLQFKIRTDVNDNPICRTEKETQMYRTVF